MEKKPNPKLTLRLNVSHSCSILDAQDLRACAVDGACGAHIGEWTCNGGNFNNQRCNTGSFGGTTGGPWSLG